MTPIAQRKGYALPLTLAAIAIIALIATIAAREVRTSTRTVSALSEQTRIQAALISAEQTLIYHLLTEPMGSRGIEVGGQGGALVLGRSVAGPETRLIPANGAPNQYQDGIVFARLYDQQSFLNIASLNEAAIARILDAFSVPREQHSRLAAALADYQDEDDLRRLGGAEASDYRDRPPPRNGRIQDALEICAVLGWSETPLCDDRNRLLMLVSARSRDQIAPRLVSPHVLSLLLGEEGEIEGIHQGLGRGEFRRFGDVGLPEFDIETDPLSVPGAPGPRLTIISHAPDGASARRTTLELTPNSITAPFLIRSKYVIGGTYAQSALQIASDDDVQPLPEPASNNSAR